MEPVSLAPGLSPRDMMLAALEAPDVRRLALPDE